MYLQITWWFFLPRNECTTLFAKKNMNFFFSCRCYFHVFLRVFSGPTKQFQVYFEAIYSMLELSMVPQSKVNINILRIYSMIHASYVIFTIALFVVLFCLMFLNFHTKFSILKMNVDQNIFWTKTCAISSYPAPKLHSFLQIKMYYFYFFSHYTRSHVYPTKPSRRMRTTPNIIILHGLPYCFYMWSICCNPVT